MPFSARTLILRFNELPLRIRVAILSLAVAAFCAMLASRRAKTPAELEMELVARAGALSHAVMERDGRRIASLLDDGFTDEAGRDKPRAIAALIARRTTPPIAYRPDREIYTLSPDGRFATVKNTVRIFANAPKTHRVTAADVTIIMDWALTGGAWLLRHIHRPIRRAVRLGLSGRRAHG